MSAAPRRVKGQRHFFFRGVYTVNGKFAVAHRAAGDGHLPVLPVLVGKSQTCDQDEGEEEYSPGSVSGHMVYPKVLFFIL
jgi:hypothetical protein